MSPVPGGRSRAGSRAHPRTRRRGTAARVVKHRPAPDTAGRRRQKPMPTLSPSRRARRAAGRSRATRVLLDLGSSVTPSIRRHVEPYTSASSTPTPPAGWASATARLTATVALADAALAGRDGEHGRPAAGAGERDVLGRPAQLVAQRLALCVGHRNQHEVDRGDARHRQRRSGHVPLDGVLHRAAGDGDQHDDRRAAGGVNGHRVDHVQFGDRAADLGDWPAANAVRTACSTAVGGEAAGLFMTLPAYWRVTGPIVASAPAPAAAPAPGAGEGPRRRARPSKWARSAAVLATAAARRHSAADSSARPSCSRKYARAASGVRVAVEPADGDRPVQVAQTGGRPGHPADRDRPADRHRGRRPQGQQLGVPGEHRWPVGRVEGGGPGVLCGDRRLQRQRTAAAGHRGELQAFGELTGVPAAADRVLEAAPGRRCRPAGRRLSPWSAGPGRATR